MGCKASYLSTPPHLTPSPLLDAPSKRFSNLTVLEKSPIMLEFTLKLLPYNNEIERVSSISIEMGLYSIQNRPLNDYTFLDIFYDNQDDIKEENFLFKLRLENTGEKMLLKMVPFQDYQDYSFKQAIYEIYLMKSQNQKNLLKLRDFFVNDFGKNRKKFLILLFEDAEFTLADLILYRKAIKNPWKEPELQRIFLDFAEIGLQLESAQICHRDIRPENFWYSFTDGTWKLANFHSARLYDIFNNEAFSHDLLLNSFRGRPEYQSPEIRTLISDTQEKTHGVYNANLNDVYGFGLVFLMMQKTEMVLEKEWVDKAEIMETWDNCLSVEVICKMMNGNAKRRMFFGNLKEILQKSVDREVVMNSRKIDFQIYSELKEEMGKNKNLAQDIWKKEKFAHAYFKLLLTEKALNQFDELLSFFESNFDELNRANTLKQIGEFSLLLGNSKKGKEFFKESLEIYTKLGDASRKDGDFKKAVDIYEKALVIAGLLYSSNDPQFIQVLEFLGNVYRLTGKYRQAKECQEKVLGILIKLKGEKSMEVARVLNNLANTYAGMKDYDTSIELLRNSIKTIRTEFARDNPNLLAMALCNLGEIYRHKKQLQEAKNCIEEGLIIKEQLFGSGPSLDIAVALDNLGNVYYDLQEFLKARKLYEKALIMKEGELGDFSLEIAISYNNLGNVCRCLKEYKVSEGYFKKGSQIYSAHIKERHIGYAFIVGNLGILYKDMNKKGDAKRFLKEAVMLMRENQWEGDKDFTFFKEELEKLK